MAPYSRLPRGEGESHVERFMERSKGQLTHPNQGIGQPVSFTQL